VGRLILIRHGESAGNRERRFTPHPEIPLTDLGREQARAAAAHIREGFAPSRIVSSPLVRARQTAVILSEILALEVGVEHDLRERDMGEFAGQLYAAPRPGFDPAAWWEWRPPGGETLAEVAVRAGRALERIAAAAPREDVVVVSHGGVMLALVRHLTGAWGEGRVARNAEILVAGHDGNGYWTLDAMPGMKRA